jgi:N-carbamoyl-L-amino-acid hydrolase
MTSTVTSLMRDLHDVGRDPVRGGYSRPVFSSAELDMRTWFVEQAQRRGLEVETDRNGIMWAWLDAADGRRTGAVVTGSHLDSVPGGGEFDGPLGVASALSAVDILKARDIQLARPIAITVFPEEEGSRFGMACLGSQLMTGVVDPDRIRNLSDDSGRTFAEVAAANGLDPFHIGEDRSGLARIGRFIELHVEQGRGLIDTPHAVGVSSSIIGHGRWKVSVTGQGNHAGATLMADRRDPMVAAAQIVTAIRDLALGVNDSRATVGRLTAIPGGTNVIASRVDVWIDVRHPDDGTVGSLIEQIRALATLIARQEGCEAELKEESFSPTATFDAGMQRDLATIVPNTPLMASGAGHDAGVLSAHVPSAMLFVRNPTGISHSPEEFAEAADCEAGAEALADVLAHYSASAVNWK